MTKLLFLEDSYAKEFDASVEDVSADGLKVALNQTLFYPTGGGQPCDMGELVNAGDGRKYTVTEVRKEEGRVWHAILSEAGHAGEGNTIKPGDKVHGVIDWERRYKLMRMHTAAHLLGEVIYKETKALTTGNQLGIEESRIDSALEEMDNEKAQSFIETANELLSRNMDVKTYSLPRDEAMKREGIVKLAMGLPEHISVVRIVDIGGYDVQADGGTHVSNTREVGQLEFVKTENKGKGKRRLYFRLK